MNEMQSKEQGKGAIAILWQGFQVMNTPKLIDKI